MKHRPTSLALFGTSLVAVVAGVVWYLQPLFGGLRMDLLGIPQAGAIVPSPVFLVLKLILAFVGAHLVARLLVRLSVTGIAAGARVGLVLGLISLTLSFDSAQAGQPLVLILTDGIFMVLSASVMGALLAGALGRRGSTQA